MSVTRSRQRDRHPRLRLGLLTLMAALAAGWPVVGQQIQRDSFGGREPVWVRGEADVRYTLKAHTLTDTFSHSLPTSEYFQINSELGSQIHYDYAVPRAPISEELSVSVWVRATKPGVQLRARLVLPKEAHPNKVGEPLTTTLVGNRCELTGRWQRLELPSPVRLVRQQQQVLRTELRRDVDLTDAYIDRLMLNLYTGPGESEVWVDDLEIGPVSEHRPAISVPQPGLPPTDLAPPPSRPDEPRVRSGTTVRPVVELNRDRLLVGGKPFFFRAIRHTGTPLAALKEAGFNTLYFDANTPDHVLEEAAAANFWLVPTLPSLPGPDRQLASRDNGLVEGQTLADARLTATQRLGQLVSRFQTASYSDAVLFWDVGGGHTAEEEAHIARTVQAVKSVDGQRPVAADAWDGLWAYSRHLDLVGVHRWPLMTSLELPQYRDWLNQRRLLARPGTFMWTWVQTHLPEWYSQLIYERPTAEGFDEPIGPQPEQIRLTTYIALSAGCRGLGFWSDRFLADSHQGRDRLLQLALLNQEMMMLEPILLTLNEAPLWVETSQKNVKAAVLRSERGVLAIPMWIGDGAQYVPGQSAAAALTVTVPQVPASATAWLVSPGDVRALKSERVTGGTKVTIPDFGVTAAVVFTSDTSPNGLVVRWQQHTQHSARHAAQWSYDLTRAELEKVEKVQRQLEPLAPPVPDAPQLLEDCRHRLAKARQAWNEGNFRDAYLESQRAARPLRILMRSHWDNAVKTVDVPGASPYAVSFFTLPRHWQLWAAVRQGRPGIDALLGGDFEAHPKPGERKAALGTDQAQKLASLPVGERYAQRLPNGKIAPWPQLYPLVQRDRLGRDIRSLPNPPDPPEPNQTDSARSPTLLTSRPRSPLEKDAPLQTLPLPDGWTTQQATLDGVTMQARVVEYEACEGQGCLQLKITAKDRDTADGKKMAPPAALDRTYLAVQSPVVKLRPGTLVRMSAWARIPEALRATADGALIYDSSAGEPLAVRVTNTTAWQKYSLYRRVPANGTIQVTLMLTGLGSVYFDDVRIEPIEG